MDQIVTWDVPSAADASKHEENSGKGCNVDGLPRKGKDEIGRSLRNRWIDWLS